MKNSYFFISKSVIFICWWIFKDNEENQELYIKKDDFWKTFKQIKFLLFDSKDFIFINISAKCIFWQIFKEIVENQDLYRKKDDFWNKFETNLKKNYLKDYVFFKYMCKMYKL